MTIRRRTIDSPIGPLTVVADDIGVRRILFAREDLADLVLAAAGPDGEDLTGPDIPESQTTDAVLDPAVEQLGRYFDGDLTEFDLPLHLVGTEFQKEAWLALADIPYGETTTYGRQAKVIGRPDAFRAVGAANGANPIPIVLPCHRVVGSDGSLTGFGGGLDVKRMLLDHEVGAQQLPF